MSKGTPLRSIRISDELWHAAIAKAAGEDRTVSEVMREMLTRWVKR